MNEFIKEMIKCDTPDGMEYNEEVFDTFAEALEALAIIRNDPGNHDMHIEMEQDFALKTDGVLKAETSSLDLWNIQVKNAITKALTMANVIDIYAVPNSDNIRIEMIFKDLFKKDI